jgi:hypothetical protein
VPACWIRAFALCILYGAFSQVGFGQSPFPSTTPGALPPSPSYPSTPATSGSTAFPATTLPPVTTVPSPYSTPTPYSAPPAYPSPTSTYNPYAPTFQPSTAPASSQAPSPSSFNQVYNSWMDWLNGNSTSASAPSAYGQPNPYGTSTFGVPAYGQPMANPGAPAAPNWTNPYPPNPYAGNP